MVFLGSVISRTRCSTPSRPTPEFLKPPKGIESMRTSLVSLMTTAPTCNLVGDGHGKVDGLGEDSSLEAVIGVVRCINGVLGLQ